MATLTTLPVQQPQASIYNTPCRDLLDGGRRQEYLRIGVPLYNASMDGNLEAAKGILQGHEYLLRYSITERDETPLHVAAAGHNTEFVRYLVSMMSSVDLELQNGVGNTAFCIAAITGNVGMAKVMLEKNQALPIIRGSGNMTPLCVAAFHGNLAMVTFLYDQSRSDIMMGNGWTNDDMDGVLSKCVKSGFFDFALRMLKDNVELPQDKHAWDVLRELIRWNWAFSDITWPIFRHIASFLDLFGLEFPFISALAFEESNAIILLRLLWKRIMEKPKDVIDDILRGPMIKTDNMETYPDQILFIAAKANNKKVLAELIREYPDLIWKRNDDGQTIFHLAVAYRHQDVYSLLYEIGSMSDLITPIMDNQGNNILHLVGKNPEKNSYADLEAAPFKIHSEYLWFREVERIVPPSCRYLKNRAGKTPQKLYQENHSDLHVPSVTWILETIKQYMVVSALIWTVGYSIVFSVPGGFDEKTGFPIFLRNKEFATFIVYDIISFFFSTISICIFLSIILTRRNQTLESLERKWMAGQYFLLLSILFICYAFTYSISILYQGIIKVTSLHIILNGAFSLAAFVYCIPILQLYKDAIIKYIPLRFLFRAKKHMLYRKL